MEIVNINLDGKESLITLMPKSRLLENISKENSLIVTDKNCEKLFDIEGYEVLVLDPGEPSKNFGSIQKILERAVALGLDRKATLVGVGGGVICDMCAFAASVYLRGCFVQLVPTTLLSMVDASVGGKTGIDFCGYKNLVGSFYPAKVVKIIPQFLETLPEHEYLSGLGEVIKTAYLREPEMLSILEKKSKAILNRDLELLQDLIIRSIRVKSYYVINDFREGGIRAHLNLGHTFAHALESVEKLGGVTHGEAVVWGMVKAGELAQLIYKTEGCYLDRLKALIKLYGYKSEYQGHSPDKIIKAMQHDKKKLDNQLRFIIQQKEFHTEIVAVDEKILLSLFAD